MNRAKRLPSPFLLSIFVSALLVVTPMPHTASAEESGAPRTATLRHELEALRTQVESIPSPLRDRDLWRALGDAEKVAESLGAMEVDGTSRTQLTLHLARSFARLSRAETGGRVAGQSEAAATARLRAVETFLRVAGFGRGSEEVDLRSRYWAEGELAQLYLDGDRSEEGLHLARRAFRAANAEGDALARYRFGTVLARALETRGDRAGAAAALRDASRLGERLRRDRLNRLSDVRAQPRQERSAFRAEDFDGDVEATQLLLGLLIEEIEADPAPRPSEAVQVRLREIRDLVETQRSAEVENYFGDICLQDGATSLTDAGPGALVLYPILLEKQVALLTNQNGVLDIVRAPITSRALLDHARDLRKLLEKRTTRQYLRPAQHLYDALIRPLDQKLGTENAEVLVVVPDGLLRTIPFAALYDAERRRFLIDEVAVALVPSMRLTNPAPLNRTNLSVLAAGLETATNGFERLAHTRQEVNQVAEHFPTSQLLFDEDFATERLAEEIANRPYSVVHLATHGRVEGNGRESFLVTRDGRIGLDRMTELISTTQFRRESPLELLTLSACETAGGDADAALGLAGVAVRAGARSALATLWPVNDEATSELIDQFYAELIKPNQTRAGALRSAQQTIRERNRYAHPGYWAPFLMISNWR
ncbi:MAG: CHAT domain-containing protein [Myxococcota bacterium]